MDSRRRIRDFTYKDERWITVARARWDPERLVWIGNLCFFRDSGSDDAQVWDSLRIEALDFEEIVAQTQALNVEELRGRLGRALEDVDAEKGGDP